MNPPRIGLATIALNEAEFIEAQLCQHLDWPGLAVWVWVEGACSLYAKANPEAVSSKGLSTDGTSEILRASSSDKVCYVPTGVVGCGEHDRMGEEKRLLRNMYCRLLACESIDILIVLDADEFYTLEDQQRINDIVVQNPEHTRFLFPQRHVWRPPSVVDTQGRLDQEVAGGYWAVPHLRVWRWHRTKWPNARRRGPWRTGGRYTKDHNHIMFPRETWPDDARKLYRRQDWVRNGGEVAEYPQCVHAGFARDGQHRARTNRYYVHRGEGKEEGFSRQHYVDCRAAWEMWTPGDELPHGAAVHNYDGPVPEVWRQ